MLRTVHLLRHLLRHVSLLVVVVGVLLPWLSVAGRGRSGVDSAELLVTLADLGVSDRLRWLGVLWYLAAAAVLMGWGAAAVTFSRSRTVALVGLAAGVVGWMVFLVAGAMEHSLRLEGAGPAVSLAGCAGLVAAELGARASRASG